MKIIFGEKMKTQKRKNRVSFTCVGESRTKQSFKEECDINNILKKYQRDGILQHVNRHAGSYENFPAAMEFQEAIEIVRVSQKMFDELPSSVRSRFDNSPEMFLAFCEDQENHEDLVKMGLGNPNKQKDEPAKIAVKSEDKETPPTAE